MPTMMMMMMNAQWRHAASDTPSDTKILSSEA
jgi:hypothetical protein